MDTLVVDTPRLRMHCWVYGPAEGIPLLLVHGNLTTGRFFQSLVAELPDRFRVVAPDLRGFGRTEAKGVDASRGLRDWSDDLRALVEVLGWADGRRLHAAGWSMGGGILQQYELDHPADLASITLIAPLSPYGFGATRDVDGRLSTPDAAGSGGGAVNPEFLRRLAAGDASDADPASSPRVTMRTYFWSPRFQAPDEDELIAEVLLTQTGDDFYPGSSTPSEHWPLVAPGSRGVNNAMAPGVCNTARFGDVDQPAPLLWIRGDEDQVVSDQSLFDLGTLGKLGAVPGWPGQEAYPPQPMIAQSRAVFERRRAHDGVVHEEVFHEVGHGPLIERPAEVARLMVDHMDAVT